MDKWLIILISQGFNLAINVIMGIHAAIFKTEIYFDLVGAIANVGATIAAIVLTQVQNQSLSLRSIIVGVFIIVWGTRLGLFLFNRISSVGEDVRFAKLKEVPAQIFGVFMMQTIWCATNTLPFCFGVEGQDSKIEWWTWASMAIMAFGLIIEIASDTEKDQFRKDPNNKGRYINTGLWSISRHPNQFGEMVFQWGTCLSSMQGAMVIAGQQAWILLLCPLFVTVLISFISGIPMLEKSADAKWGEEEEYQIQKKNTAVLVPFLNC